MPDCDTRLTLFAAAVTVSGVVVTVRVTLLAVR
jgi:hypothetical protein